MKRILLSMALAAAMAAPVSAQWVNDPAQCNIVSPAGSNNYGYDIQTNANGMTYVFMQIPHNETIEMRLQILDKDGVKTLPEEGQLISAEANQTWTKVNQHLLIDRDGNAVIAVFDFRKGNETYTIYKYDETGKELWSRTLGEGVDNESLASMSMVNTTDGGYMLAYEAYSYDNAPTKIYVYKLKADGSLAWSEPLLLKDDSGVNDYTYPYLVDAGDGQAMMVYAKGSNQDLMARMIDISGDDVWDEDLIVYRGGFMPSLPLYTMMDVYSAPDGGAFVAWCDPDALTSTYENRLSYIKNDATYGFSTGEEGTNVSNQTEYSRMVPTVYYDKNEKAVYMVYRQFDQAAQNLQGLFLQKMSLDGELLWGPNGKPVIDIQDSVNCSFCTIQGAKDGQIAVFYQTMAGNATNSPVGSYIALYDKEGNQVQAPVNFSTSTAVKNNLLSSPLMDDQYYLVNWNENPSQNKENICMQRVYLDGSVSGIREIDGEHNAKTLLRQEIYAPSGERLQHLSEGVNIIRNVYTDNSTSTTKKIVK